MNARLKNSLASGAVAVAALFGAVAPAQAVVYVGNWDPTFGPIFTNLGFRGTASVFLPNACIGLVGSFFNNSGLACGSGAMQIQSASVELYNITNPTVTLETLNFTSPGAVVSIKLVPVAGIGGPSGSTLSFLTSNFSTGVLSSIPLTQIGGNSYKFYLGFTDNTTTLAYTLDNFSALDCSPTKPNDGSCGFSTVSPEVKFTPAIPEPETYALMLAGLGALAFAARRQRSR
jgi:PEP-CTERM motif